MHAHDRIWRQAADFGRDDRAPVVAGGAVALVAEAAHQLHPGAGDADRPPAALRGGPGEPEPRQRRHHEMEGRVRVRAVRARVRERPDDVQELRDGPRPAVREDERQRVRLRRANVEEVDPLPVDVGGELRERVEAPLPDAPVVAAAPVLHERPKNGERHAVIPARRRGSPAQTACDGGDQQDHRDQPEERRCGRGGWGAWAECMQRPLRQPKDKSACEGWARLARVPLR